MLLLYARGCSLLVDSVQLWLLEYFILVRLFAGDPSGGEYVFMSRVSASRLIVIGQFHALIAFSLEVRVSAHLCLHYL